MTIKAIARGKRVKLRVADFPTFRRKIGDKILVPLCQVLACLEMMLSLTEQHMALLEDPASNRSQVPRIMMTLALVVETADMVEALTVTLWAERELEQQVQDLKDIVARWKKRRFLRTGIGFHIGPDLMKKGLDVLTETPHEPVLVDEFSRFPRYTLGLDAVLAGAKMETDTFREIATDYAKDIQRVSALVHEVIAHLIKSRGIDVQRVSNTPDADIEDELGEP